MSNHIRNGHTHHTPNPCWGPNSQPMDIGLAAMQPVPLQALVVLDYKLIIDRTPADV